MDGDKLSQVIAAIEDASNDEDALRRALLFLLAILQRPETYNNSKSRPLSEFKELVHWTLLAFSPIARHVSGSEGLNLSHGFRARRKLNADGKFSIEIDGLFPPKVEESLPTYEYDVCISFAGEQRNIAESLATKMKEEFYLRVFYDDFEKLDLWGRDLFKHLYEVYSIKSQYCIVLFSDAYLAKNWTAHELRAAQSRIIKERSPYVLPVLIDPTVEPPREFENIAYLTLDPTDLEPICSEVNERIWSVKKNHWLVVEEIAELINEGFQFRLTFSPFREQMNKVEHAVDKLAVFILGLAWCCAQDKVSSQLNGVFEYILFAFPPVALRFDDEDETLVVPPDGTIRRMIGPHGPVLMKQAFWDPIYAQWKEDYPQMFGDEEDSDDEIEEDVD